MKIIRKIRTLFLVMMLVILPVSANVIDKNGSLLLGNNDNNGALLLLKEKE